MNVIWVTADTFRKDHLGCYGNRTIHIQVKLIKMGGRIVRHARRVVFQLAEVAVSRDLFAAILKRVTRLCPSPD